MQKFAARYQMYAMRERDLQDQEDLLQRQTWYQHPERYEQLFLRANPYEPEPLTVGGRDIEEVVNEVDQMDAYFANLEEKRHVSGDQVAGIFGPQAGEWM